MSHRTIFPMLATVVLLAACAHAAPGIAEGSRNSQAGLEALSDACQSEARLTPHRTGGIRNDFTYVNHVRKMTAACQSLAADVRAGKTVAQERDACLREAGRGDLLLRREPLFQRHVEHQSEICNRLAALGQSGGLLQTEWLLYALN